MAVGQHVRCTLAANIAPLWAENSSQVTLEMLSQQQTAAQTKLSIWFASKHRQQ